MGKSINDLLRALCVQVRLLHKCDGDIEYCTCSAAKAYNEAHAWLRTVDPNYTAKVLRRLRKFSQKAGKQK